MSRDDSSEDLVINVADSLLDTDFGPLPVTPTGEFVPAATAFESAPIPEANEENFICLRGPCRHYLQQTPYFAAGNTAGSLEYAPVMIRRTCMAITGYEIDLTDEVMKDCSAWDPLMPEEVAARNSRRDRYYQIKKTMEIK